MSDPYLAVVLAFVVGVLVGASIDDLFESVHHHKGKLMTDKPKVLTWLLTICIAANIGIGALMIVSRVQQTDIAREQTRFTECVADYNQQFSSAYKARLASSGQATDALDRVMMAVSSKDEAEFKAALADYVKLRLAAKAQQRANPYPALPDDYCGKVAK